MGRIGRKGGQDKHCCLSVLPFLPFLPLLPFLPRMRKLTIAIDGPSGAGKGTVARAIARALGYRHVDSGAMYRAVGWKALDSGVALDDEPALAALADALAHRHHRCWRRHRRYRRHTRDSYAGDRSGRRIGRPSAQGSRRPCRAAACARRRRRDRHGRPRHRHGGVSRRGREDLSRRVTRRAGAAPCARSRACRDARRSVRRREADDRAGSQRRDAHRVAALRRAGRASSSTRPARASRRSWRR